ncbi:hypothetical protein CLV63_11322 [Murinocardiopsis flavida]|uniref:J domain-containing protein n=1 Tax=Murinocardiopsis flavida TaxID=645275 RepID=A0A2P8DF75_9ACTN|nr:hypothetical protein [Murinocardiopsis flavida]PSK95859.1 hypothetical protein CLV63_11322 [Murinocardiopsis flavida]
MNGDRASFRRWVREHHPDAGGDPAAFADGLARWQRGVSAPAGHGAVRVHRTPRTPFAAAAAAIRRVRERRERARRLR